MQVDEDGEIKFSKAFFNGATYLDNVNYRRIFTFRQGEQPGFLYYLPKPLYLLKVRQENKHTFAKMLKKSQFCNKVEAIITAQPKPIDNILGDIVLHLIAAPGVSISKSGVVIYLQPNIGALVEHCYHKC